VSCGDGMQRVTWARQGWDLAGAAERDGAWASVPTSGCSKIKRDAGVRTLKRAVVVSSRLRIGACDPSSYDAGRGCHVSCR
jgi:hypothetical protein